MAARVLSGAMVAIGLAMVVSTVARGGGPLTVGVVVGLLIAAAGAGRLYVEARR